MPTWPTNNNTHTHRQTQVATRRLYPCRSCWVWLASSTRSSDSSETPTWRSCGPTYPPPASARVHSEVMKIRVIQKVCSVERRTERHTLFMYVQEKISRLTSCSSSSPVDRSVGSCMLDADGREGNLEGNLTLGDSCFAITKSNSGDRFSVSGSW